MNAIRVVVSYGQEMREVKIYSRYLEQAKKAGIKRHIKGSVVAGAFISLILMTYAFAFYMGSVWIENDI